MAAVAQFFLDHAPANFILVAHPGELRRQAFERLADQLGWENQLRHAHWQEFNRAVIVDAIVAGDGSLPALQAMIRTFRPNLPEHRIPISRRKCLAMIKTFYINIYQFSDGVYFDHGSKRKLKKYSVRNNLIMPKLEAKANDALKKFLRQLFF